MKKIFFSTFLILLLTQFSFAATEQQHYTENLDLINDYIDMARLYTSSADYEKALDYIKVIEKISPNNPEIMYEKAIILKNYNQPILARNLMREVAQIAPEYKESYLYKEFFKDDLPGFYMPKDYNADYYTKKGYEFYNEGKYEKATEYFQKAVQLSKTPETLNNLGMTYIKTSNPKQALKIFEDAINLDVRYYETYINLAEYYGEIEHNPKKQIQYLKHSIKLNPRNAYTFYLIGNSYLKKEMYETAVEYFKLAISKDETMFDAHYALGTTLYKMGEYEQAYFVFEKSLNYELDNEKVYDFLTKSAIKIGKYDSAESYANKLASISPTPENYIQLAKAMYMKGDYNSTINLLNTKVLGTNYSEKYNYLGQSNFQKGNITEAISNFQRAASLRQKPIYYYNLAVCYNTSNDKEMTQLYINKAQNAPLHEIQDYLDLVKLYQDLGNNNKILEILTKAITAYPNEMSLYKLKLNALKQLNMTKEYEAFKTYMNGKFPKDNVYKG